MTRLQPGMHTANFLTASAQSLIYPPLWGTTLRGLKRQTGSTRT